MVVSGSALHIRDEHNMFTRMREWREDENAGY
jgi:hypothetical protein